MFADYKGTRKGMPDELQEQVPVIREVFKGNEHSFDDGRRFMKQMTFLGTMSVSWRTSRI